MRQLLLAKFLLRNDRYAIFLLNSIDKKQSAMYSCHTTIHMMYD